MRKYSKIRNIDRVHEDAREVIFFEELKGESLENVVEYWVMINKGGTIVAEFTPEDNSDKRLLVKEINNKIKEIEILIDKLSKQSNMETEELLKELRGLEFMELVCIYLEAKTGNKITVEELKQLEGVGVGAYSLGEFIKEIK